MASHYRTHSTASSTGSLSDDLALYSSSSNNHRNPLHDDPYSSYSYAGGGGGAGDASMSELGDSPYVGGGAGEDDDKPTGRGGKSAPSTAGGAGGGRSRARAFSFLSAHHPYGPREGSMAGESPATGETPFVGGAYDFALDASEDALSVSSDDDGAVEMQQRGEAATSRMAGGGGRTYRTRFQPLVGVELAWMGVSAGAVLALTVWAVVLTWVG
ncbi:hypothetical protein JCM8547_005702 [Rhodosporidiobolus lusitaniae]